MARCFRDSMPGSFQCGKELGREQSSNSRDGCQCNNQNEHDQHGDCHGAGYWKVERSDAGGSCLREKHAEQTEMDQHSGNRVNAYGRQCLRRIDTAALKEPGGERDSAAWHRNAHERRRKLDTQIWSQWQSVRD